MTNHLKFALPQLQDLYGPNEEVHLMLNFTDIEPKFTFSDNLWKLDLSLIVSLLVKEESALIARFDDFTLTGNVWSSDFKLYAHLEKPTATKVTVIETTLKDMTEDLLKEELKLCLYALIDEANVISEKGVSIP